MTYEKLAETREILEIVNQGITLGIVDFGPKQKHKDWQPGLLNKYIINLHNAT